MISKLMMNRPVGFRNEPSASCRANAAIRSLVVLVVPLQALGQVSINLVPHETGQFSGGETVTVDVVLNNPGGHLPLLLTQMDFADSDPALSFPDDFAWGLLPADAGDGTMPVPRWSTGKPVPEGPGCGCADGIDNDCDGLIGLDDSNCGGHDLRVQCSLPTLCSASGDDCLSTHTAA